MSTFESVFDRHPSLFRSFFIQLAVHILLGSGEVVSIDLVSVHARTVFFACDRLVNCDCSLAPDSVDVHSTIHVSSFYSAS